MIGICQSKLQLDNNNYLPPGPQLRVVAPVLQAVCSIVGISPQNQNSLVGCSSSEKLQSNNTVDPFKNATAKKCDPRGVSLKCYM